MPLTPTHPLPPAVLCQNIREAVQPQLDANCPAALSGLELGRFTLGKRCGGYACMHGVRAGCC